ncbi:MAG: Gfo/Idh/MocA family oxidoreductase [Eubacteriales bacterium]|nr:Gfo/Idh/MocA family oxidoreductase [Eubacteriales bacterium]
MKEIKLGTIGSGIIVKSILDNVKLVDGIALEAVYSRTEEKGRALASEYGVDKVYTDMDAFLADEEVNFVYVASPNSLHYAYSKAALLAGKNVLCEKPFAPVKAEAEELVTLAKEKGLMIVDATPTAFLPNLAILREQISKIGKIKLVMGNYSQYSSRYDALLRGEIPNVFSPDFAGGCLMDINYYNVYLNVALFGKPEKTVYYPNVFENLVDTSGTILLQYDEFVSSMVGAKDTWGVNYFQIEGEKGYIYIKNGSNGIEEVEVVTKEGKEILNSQPNPDRWFYEVENFTKMILDGDVEKVNAGLETMIDVIDVIESSRKAAGIYFTPEK